MVPYPCTVFLRLTFFGNYSTIYRHSANKCWRGQHNSNNYSMVLVVTVIPAVRSQKIFFPSLMVPPSQALASLLSFCKRADDTNPVPNKSDSNWKTCLTTEQQTTATTTATKRHIDKDDECENKQQWAIRWREQQGLFLTKKQPWWGTIQRQQQPTPKT